MAARKDKGKGSDDKPKHPAKATNASASKQSVSQPAATSPISAQSTDTSQAAGNGDEGKGASTNLTARFLVIVQGFSFGRHTVTCAAWCFVAWCFYLSVRELAGKETILNSFIQWAASGHISEGIAWLIIIALGGTTIIRERTIKKLRKKNLPRMSHLESLLDPNRASSGLEDDGTSPAGDAP